MTDPLAINGMHNNMRNYSRDNLRTCSSLVRPEVVYIVAEEIIPPACLRQGDACARACVLISVCDCVHESEREWVNKQRKHWIKVL